MGRRVLLVDNDPQASLTQGFWGPQATRQLDPAADHRRRLPRATAVPRPGHPADRASPGIDLVPGSRHATEFNVPRPHEADRRDQDCLREFLAEVRDRLRPGADRLPAEPPPLLAGRRWSRATT